MPLLELPASQSHSQALLQNSVSSLNREGTQQVPPASALENALSSRVDDKLSSASPDAAVEADSKTTPAHFDSQKILDAVNEAEAEVGKGEELPESSAIIADPAGTAGDEQADDENNEHV